MHVQNIDLVHILYNQHHSHHRYQPNIHNLQLNHYQLVTMNYQDMEYILNQHYFHYCLMEWMRMTMMELKMKMMKMTTTMRLMTKMVMMMMKTMKNLHQNNNLQDTIHVEYMYLNLLMKRNH
jgi:hypothetical protein